MQRWCQKVAGVSLWSSAWIHLDNVGTEPLELYSITPSHCPSTTVKLPRPSDPVSLSPWDHSTMCGGELLGNLTSICTCGLQRVLREAITWSQLTEQEPGSPSELWPLHVVRVSELRSLVREPEVPHTVLSGSSSAVPHSLEGPLDTWVDCGFWSET